MAVYRISITRVEPTGATYHSVPATRAFTEKVLVQKKWWWSKPVVLTSFFKGYKPGMIWDWCSLKDQVKSSNGWVNMIKVERLKCSVAEAIATI